MGSSSTHHDISDELDIKIKKYLRGEVANLEDLKDKKLKGQLVVREELYGRYAKVAAKAEKGDILNDKPQFQVIITPSAAYGGAFINFMLCPTELVKENYKVLKKRKLQVHVGDTSNENNDGVENDTIERDTFERSEDDITTEHGLDHQEELSL